MPPLRTTSHAIFWFFSVAWASKTIERHGYQEMSRLRGVLTSSHTLEPLESFLGKRREGLKSVALERCEHQETSRSSGVFTSVCLSGPLESFSRKRRGLTLFDTVWLRLAAACFRQWRWNDADAFVAGKELYDAAAKVVGMRWVNVEESRVEIRHVYVAGGVRPAGTGPAGQGWQGRGQRDQGQRSPSQWGWGR